MPTTGPNRRLRMNTRAVAFAAAFVFLAVPSLNGQQDPVPTVLADLATALSQGDAVAAIGAFDRSMKEFGSLSANIEALVAQGEVLCAIDVVRESTTGAAQEIDADWYIQIKGRTSGEVVRRRERVHLRLDKLRGRWRITGFSPSRILEP